MKNVSLSKQMEAIISKKDVSENEYKKYCIAMPTGNFKCNFSVKYLDEKEIIARAKRLERKPIERFQTPRVQYALVWLSKHKEIIPMVISYIKKANTDKEANLRNLINSLKMFCNDDFIEIENDWNRTQRTRFGYGDLEYSISIIPKSWISAS